MPETPDAKLAVLIDADNAQPAGIDALLAEIAKFGVASVKRVVRRLDDAEPAGLEGRGQQARDPADPAVRLHDRQERHRQRDDHRRDGPALHRTGSTASCLVSSDSDFTRLAARLRESGVTVYGFGERKTPEAFVSACDRFVYMDVLRSDDSDAPDQPTPGHEAAAPRSCAATPS